MDYIKYEYTNPNGSVVEIWHHPNFNPAEIGVRAEIGANAEIGVWAKIGAWAKIGEGDKTAYPIYCAPLPMGPHNYYVTITSKTMAIGYEIHPLKDWFGFDDKRILAMDGKPALKYWRTYRDIFKAMAVANGWME